MGIKSGRSVSNSGNIGCTCKTTQKVKVHIVMTSSSEYVGNVHLHYHGRVSTYLNDVTDDFIPVTDVKLFNGETIILNKHLIESVREVGDLDGI